MRICNLYGQKTNKLCNISAGTLVSLVDSELNVDKEYYIKVTQETATTADVKLVNVKTGELVTKHPSSKAFIHQDAALVIDFIDRG